MSCLLATQSIAASPTPKSQCLAAQTGYPVKVAAVVDGDTVQLNDQRLVRLIGLNTLELHAPQPTDKAIANQAKQALEQFLTPGGITLIPGLEPRDRHGRTLGHLQLSDGRNAAHYLVEQGLAVAVAIGDNTRCADDLKALEQSARERRQGIWHTPGRWLVKGSLTGHERGFHMVSGRVTRIRHRQLLLDTGLRIFLGQHWPTHYPPLTPEQLLGRRIQIRGWLNPTAGRLGLTLHHPSNLDMVTH